MLHEKRHFDGKVKVGTAPVLQPQVVIVPPTPSKAKRKQ